MMTMIPERKKSPDELNALRGKLGVPTVVPVDVPAEPLPRLGASQPVDDEPLPEPVLDPASGLPLYRHSAEELERLHRRFLSDAQSHLGPIPVLRERTWLIALAYLFTLSAIALIHLELPIILPLAIAVVSAVFAAFVYFKRPYSKHHGAFLGMVVLFVLSYTVMTSFP